MNVSFVDLKRQNDIHRQEFLQAVTEVIESAEFVLGPSLVKFEQEFARYCNKSYCVGVNSGTDALKLALSAYGIGPGDEVITAPNSYFSTAMVISEIGAVPVFVDINPTFYTLDSGEVEKKITKKTRAIVPVHFAGQSADMSGLLRLAQKHRLIIVEDSCQAHGAEYKGRRMPYTETGVFSFYPGKNLGCFGDGGAVVTNNRKIKDAIILLRNDGSKEKYQHLVMGFKSRLDCLQAKILHVKLSYLSKWNDQRRQHAELYNFLLSPLKPALITPVENHFNKHIYHLYIIEADKRNQLQKYLFKNGISTVIHYPIPIHLQLPYRNQGYKTGDFPVTEAKAERILSLPMFPEMKEKEISFVCQKILEFYRS